MLKRLVKGLRWVAIASAVAYPGAEVLFALFLRYSDGWIANILLYAPRHAFLLPIPVWIALLLILKQKRLLWTQLLALGIALFPLMGLVLPRPTSDPTHKPFRVLSFNVNSGYGGHAGLVAEIKRLNADIVFIQESKGATGALHDQLKSAYEYIEVQGYSFVLSHFPIVETTEHSKLEIDDWARSGRFQRYLVQTPRGRIVIYNVHPISPRGTLNLHRFRGAFHAIRTGQAINSETIADLQYNVRLRQLQLAAVGQMARKETLPVILAGDFNLPELSSTFHSNLGDFQDGFRAAGSGFGYSFPAKFPWMRLDRVLASYQFRFVSFEAGCDGLSDHRCVVAELELEAGDQ